MKVLIYYDEKKLKPVGGPSGYLYNLQQELIRKKINYIDFLKLEQEKETFKKKLKKKIPKKLKKILKKITHYKSEILKNVFSENKKYSMIELNGYEVIHFHSTLDMYMVKDSLKNYKGIVLLTTHSPKVFHKEIIEDYTDENEYKKK